MSNKLVKKSNLGDLSYSDLGLDVSFQILEAPYLEDGTKMLFKIDDVENFCAYNLNDFADFGSILLLRQALANKGYSFQSEKGGKWSVIVKSGDRKLVLKEYGHMTLLEVAEWVKTAKQLNKEDIDKMFEKNTEKSNVKNDDCKIGGHVVPDDMAKNFGAVEVDGAVDVPDHTWDEEAEMKKDTDRFHVLA